MLSTTMKSFPTSISIIPDDIILKIFNLLPFETLHKCRWVSKSWQSLITHEVFPKIIQYQFLGFFYRIGFDDVFSNIEKSTNDKTNTTTIDTLLDFLPCWASKLLMIKYCCNGLILYEGWVDECYVCNPMTMSWIVVRGCGFFRDCILLDFDPWISPHFRLVAFFGQPNSVLVRMYCSGTKRWVKKRIVDCEIYVGSFPSRVGCFSLWNGELYVKSFLTNSSAEESYKIVRFGLSESDVGFEIVEFSRGTKMPRGATYIGRLGDKLGFAGLDGLQLRVWIMSPKLGNMWVRLHKGDIFSPRCLERNVTPPYIVGFHPLRSAVLIYFERHIFAYDLVGRSCVEICHIGFGTTHFTPAPIFPFLTCTSTLLENRNDHQACSMRE